MAVYRWLMPGLVLFRWNFENLKTRFFKSISGKTTLRFAFSDI